MSETGGTNAAATLSLQIDTKSAQENIDKLNAAYNELHANMSKKVGADLGGEINKSVKSLQGSLATVAALINSTNNALDDIVAAGSRSFAKISTEAKNAAQAVVTLSEAMRANTAAAQASSNAATVKLLKERAEAATLAAEAEKRLAQVTAANISSAQASSNAATVKLLKERAEAATLAAEAEKRLAQVTAANISSAQASSNAATVKLLKERAEAATLAAEAEKRLAQVAAANISSAQASSNAATQRLIQQRTSGTATPRYNPLMNTVDTAVSATQSASAIKELDSAHKSLALLVKQNTENQVHWNKAINEGHAAVRGLSGGLGALWLTYGSIVPLLAGAAVGATAKNIVTVGKDLEYQFTFIKAIADGAVVSVNDFKEAMSGSLFDPSEAANGLRILTQAGLSAQDAMAALPNVLKLAAVGETDLATAAQSATAIMHTFSLSVNDISHIGDVFGTAARLSATSVGEMMEAMKQASSVADVFGVSMEETAAALATLANRGIEGSSAGTAVRNMIKEMASPATEKAAYAMAQYGIQIHNADGSAKTFTENLRQLANVTSVMTDKTKARFLEDLFNERGAKAANILLSDMEKMNNVLKELEQSSKGLGFMTEAQIQLAQSTEGIIKQLVSSAKLVYSEVFTAVKPQIDNILLSITDLVNSSQFKEVLSSLANTIADITVYLKDHIGVVSAVIAAYAGFKVIGGIGVVVATLATKFVALSEAMAAAETAAALANAEMAATGVATTATSATLAKLGLLISGTFVVGLAAAAAAWVVITLKTREYDTTLVELVKATEASVASQRRLNNSIEDGLSALIKSNDLQAERIRLLREGISAAGAAAKAMNNLGYASAKAAETQASSALRVAQDKLNSPEFKGQDINFNPSPAYEEAFDNVQKLTKVAKDAKLELERAATASVQAGMEGRRKEAQDIAEKAYQEVEVQNKKFDAIVERARLAKIELDKNDLYGTNKEKEARRATLLKDIARGEKAAQFKPIDTRIAETDEAKIELRRREAFLSESSLTYERKPAAAKTGSTRGAIRDQRTIAQDTLASAIKQEQIRLSKELLDIEIDLAGQSISSAAAIAKKNAANKASLETERKIIEAELASAKASGDQVRIAKVSNDLAENTIKIEKQEKDALLDLTKERVSSKTALEDISVSSVNYLEDLRLEREALDLTAQEVTALRIEREREREQQALSIKSDRKQITEDQYNVERGLIDLKAQARLQEEEFQASFIGGWKKAYKEYADAAGKESKRAADMFKVFTSSMENALDTFIDTGKLNFADFAKSIIKELAKIEAKGLVFNIMGVSGGTTASRYSALLGGKPGGSETPTDQISSLFDIGQKLDTVYSGLNRAYDFASSLFGSSASTVPGFGAALGSGITLAGGTGIVGYGGAAAGTATGAFAGEALGAGITGGSAFTGAGAATGAFAGEALGAGVTGSVATGAAAGGTAATGAAAAIPYVGWVVAAAAVLYSIFGKSGAGKSQGAAAYTDLVKGVIGGTSIGEGPADKYASAYQLPLNTINASFLGAINSLGTALGNNQNVSIASSIKARGDGKQYGGVGVAVNGSDIENLSWAYDAEDQQATAKLAAQALSTALVSAIQRSTFSSQIKALFDGLTSPEATINMIQSIVALTKVSEQLNDTWALTVDQAAGVAKLNNDGTEQGRVAAVQSMAQLALAQKTISSALFETYQSIGDPFKVITDSKLPITLKEFDNALKGVDKSTQEGIEKFALLFSMRTGFNEFVAAVNNARSSLDSTIDSFRTLDDRVSRQQAVLDAAAKEAGIAVPTDGSEFVKLADSIDYTTEAGLHLALTLPGVVNAFKALQELKEVSGTDVSGERESLQEQLDELTLTSTQLLEKQRAALDSSNRALFDQIQLANRAKQVADERKELQEQLDALILTSVQLLEKQRNALDESNRALFDQIQLASKAKQVSEERAALQDRLDAAIGNTAELRRKELEALDPSNRALLQRIFDIEDAKTAAEVAANKAAEAESETKKALSELESAYDKRLSDAKSRLQTAYNKESSALSELIGKMARFSQSARAMLLSITESSDSPLTGGERFRKAKESLPGVISRAYAADETSLTELRSYLDLSKENSPSFIDYARDFAKVSNVLKEAADSADAQESTAKRQLDALKKQVDVLLGIDDSVLTVAEAIAALNAATSEGLAGVAATVLSAGNVSAGAISAAIPSANSTSPTTGHFNIQTAAGQASQLAYENSTWSPESDAAKRAYGDAIMAINEAMLSEHYGARRVDDTYRAEIFRSFGVPGYAKGGDFAGGVRLVGEDGPEVEVTGPSRIFNASQTRAMFADNSDTVNELKALRAEVELLRAEARATAVNIGKSTRTLDRIMPEGDALNVRVLV